ncbi:hypothetical protein [Streptomyces sp. ISL-94]|uniref:hypothetical protein n=1 Tax=Streptomyces sp. ISL-94 TaxID=2819190 RepID=UPI001BE90426|nr:hypothetical protein [Streptomyces sp. ISL-94]MBT2482449.1 hypothetical protein [Streptomyces sp. ISL-94]
MYRPQALVPGGREGEGEGEENWMGPARVMKVMTVYMIGKKRPPEGGEPASGRGPAAARWGAARAVTPGAAVAE